MTRAASKARDLSIRYGRERAEDIAVRERINAQQRQEPDVARYWRRVLAIIQREGRQFPTQTNVHLPAVHEPDSVERGGRARHGGS